MSNPTTPFSWQMPTATDLVTDLPADFEVFGQAVATSMGDLLGGSSGYILSKASATDMDFTWIPNDQGDITGITAGNGITVTSPTGPVPTVAIDTAVTVDLTTAQTLTNKTLTSPALTTPTISTLTTNGDLLYGTGSGALARRGIGSTGNVLTVSGGLPVWSAPAGGGGKVLQVVEGSTTTGASNSTSTPADTNLTATITPTLATSKVLVFFTQNGCLKSGGATNSLVLRLLRGATQLTQQTQGNGANTSSFLGSFSNSVLDSPGTTSATTYKTQFLSSNNSDAMDVQATTAGYTSRSSIILMEIGA